MFELEVLNPIAKQRAMKNIFNINSRPKTIDNKTIGLVWSGTHGGDVALKRAGEMLQDKFSNVVVNFYTGGNYPTPPDILSKAAKESDLIIGATGD